MVTLFLGGTCGNHPWRRDLIDWAKESGLETTGWFDPFVSDWSEQIQAAEDLAKQQAEVLLFYLASSDLNNPEGQVPAYSLVEATMALYDDPERTVIVFDDHHLKGHPARVLKKVGSELRSRFPEAVILSSMVELKHRLKFLVDGG